MGLNFERPYLLILIPLLIAGILYTSKWLNRIRKNKKIIITVIRSIVVTLLILSLSGMTLTWKLNNMTTLFLIDASDSTHMNKSEMEDFVKEAYKLKGAKDKLGVISFGDNVQVESFISNDIGFAKLEGKINGNYTNIENAIATSLSLFPNDSNKRLVLISDGEENSGSTSKIAMSLLEQGINFKFHKIQRATGDETLVEKIEVPEKLSLDEEFNILVTINSTSVQKATLILESERTKLSQQTVELQKGVNKFVFRDKAVTGGFKGYSVLIQPEKDTELKNNQASTFTNVLAKPKILVIEDVVGESDELVKMLKASSMNFNVVNAKNAPGNIQDMSAYKSIITCNVMVDSLNVGFKNSLESYVKDFGGGFIATGGDNSFALGGYSNTPLEKVLPVNMQMRGKKETPKMAMILIIDKSGSMSEGVAGISKVDMAKEGAIRSLESLRVDKDEIGVLSLDGAYSWIVKRQIITNPKAIEDDIGTIRADGGTSIIPSLQAAYNSLKESDAKIKHIILLTDGLAERTGYDELFSNINKESITVSTVAVGQDSDKELLGNIATTCNGRFYVTDAYTNIPSIFTKETFMAARTYLNNREFTPVINYEHTILKGVSEGGLPSLLGYIGASEKDTARVLLRSDEDDPILTIWQYGLGKSVAWNSDVTGKWNSNYIPWNKNLKLWQNIINFTVENFDNENASLEVVQKGQKATITLKNKNVDTNLESTAVVLSPSGESLEIRLNPVAPGEYEGTIDIKENGVYMVNGKQYKNGELTNAVNSGYAVQYSPEYKINNSSNIDKIVTEIGGKIITEPKDVFIGDKQFKSGQKNLTGLLLVLFLLLFMIDIALRRLNLNTYKVRALWEKIRKKKQRDVKKSKNFIERPDQMVQSYGNIDISPELGENTEEIKTSPLVKNEERTPKNSLDTSELLRKKRLKK